MQTGFEKSIESPRIPNQHKLSVGFPTGDVAYGFLLEMFQSLQIHHIEIKEIDESQVVLHHKSFSNHVSVDLICLSFVNVIFPHLTDLAGVQHTHFVKLSNKVSNKVVTVVCC